MYLCVRLHGQHMDWKSIKYSGIQKSEITHENAAIDLFDCQQTV